MCTPGLTGRLLARLALFWLLLFALMLGVAPRSGRLLAMVEGNPRGDRTSEGEVLDSVEEAEAIEIALRAESRREIDRRPVQPAIRVTPEQPRFKRDAAVARLSIGPAYRAPPRKPLIRLLL